VIYDDEDKAFRRVEALKNRGLWWAGVIRHHDGTFTLTHDPDEPSPDLPSAPHSELGSGERYSQQHEPAGSHREHGRPEASPPLVTDAGIERVL
jgi:hypothetical protein